MFVPLDQELLESFLVKADKEYYDNTRKDLLELNEDYSNFIYSKLTEQINDYFRQFATPENDWK